MAETKTTQETPEPEPMFVDRPFGQLHDYPVSVRWEVTRRHPYYLVFWHDVLRFRRSPPGNQTDLALLGHAQSMMLGSIGVTGEPVDPATDFAELIGGETDPDFLSGSVQPVTLRAAVAMLICALPPADRASVASLLMSVDVEETGSVATADIRKRLTLDKLGQIASPMLDSCPDIPLFFIHLGASQRSIASDVEDQVRRWKARQNSPTSKVHTASLDDYLNVWDLREGWTGAGYDRARELKFNEIARRLSIGSTSTVANRYRSAFKMITGHEFKPELWWRLFGPLKLSELLGGAASALAAPVLRHLRSPNRRPVSESKLSPGTDRNHPVGIVEGISAVDDDIPFRDLLIDLDRLIETGLSDQEIADQLDLKDPATIAYYRLRAGDLRSL